MKIIKIERIKKEVGVLIRKLEKSSCWLKIKN